MPSYQHEVILPCPIQSLWDFLTHPHNLTKLSPEELKLTFQEAPERYELGSEFRFSITVMGAIVRSKHKITVWEPTTRFVEIQEEGPFKRWQQEHIFEAIGENETKLTDRMEYETPSGLVGMLLTEQRVTQQLDNGIQARQEAFEFLLKQGELA